MATIGILGVGHLARLMVRGWQGAGHSFILSPRGEETAQSLADQFGAKVAYSNQEVIDQSDAVFVSLPAATGAAELAGLTFRSGQPVLSAMAGTGLSRLTAAIGSARGAVCMMPGYANAYRVGPSILFPADDFWVEALSFVGPVHVLESEEKFTLAATFGALSGASIGWMAHLIEWYVDQGLDPQTARALVSGTLRGNAEVLMQEACPLSEISKGVATPGGITEQLLGVLGQRGGLDAWDEGLLSVLRRISGKAIV